MTGTLLFVGVSIAAPVATIAQAETILGNDTYIGLAQVGAIIGATIWLTKRLDKLMVRGARNARRITVILHVLRVLINRTIPETDPERHRLHNEIDKVLSGEDPVDTDK